jgi:hypothetical protein
MNTINPFKVWMRAATRSEQQIMAEAIGTSPGMLYHYSNENRQPSTERAIQIEKQSKVMSKASKGRLPEIMRTDLVSTCRSCEFAQKCMGGRATVSEFPIIDAKQLELPL